MTLHTVHAREAIDPHASATAEAEFGAPLVQRYVRFIPLLWLAGIHILTAASLVAYLTKRRWPKGWMINLAVLGWIGIGLTQSFSAFVNAMLMHDVLGNLHNMGAILVFGWIFGGLAIGVGYSYALATPKTVRAICVLGGMILAFGSFCGAMRLDGAEEFSIETPASMLFSSSSLKSSTLEALSHATFFAAERNSEETEIRLSIFNPWAICLGFGSIAVTMISFLEKSFGWRVIGVAGGLIGTIFSFSRIAIASLALAIAVRLFFMAGPLIRAVLITAILVLLAGLALNGLDPLHLSDAFKDAADQYRDGSSSVREMVYEQSWAGFWQSPVFGHGWPGESATSEISEEGDIQLSPVGTHSSYSGLLYTGGIITFSAFVLAYLFTFIGVLAAVLRSAHGSEARKYAVTGLTLFIALLLFSPYQQAQSDTLSSVYYFIWLGGTIRLASTEA